MRTMLKIGHLEPLSYSRRKPAGRVNGFFETVSTLRNKTILKSEQDRVWTDELKAVIAYYA